MNLCGCLLAPKKKSNDADKQSLLRSKRNYETQHQIMLDQKANSESFQSPPNFIKIKSNHSIKSPFYQHPEQRTIEKPEEKKSIFISMSPNMKNKNQSNSSHADLP